ncbi:MAG: L,D-transpeptidase family protein [Xanthobacteraceae bacterium]
MTRFVGPVPLACGSSGFVTVRTALLSGAAFALLLSVSAPAHAAPRGLGYYFFYNDPAPPAYTRRRAPAATTAAATAAAKKPNPERDGFPDVPKGTGVYQIMISIGTQRLALYHDGVRVAETSVSTGTPGHPTPKGIFSVIEKDRYHHSNLYGNAPMYYMQRLTWSGVAMHEGMLPGFAASHGCIRMPTAFASRLWPTTRLGARVVIAQHELVPTDFAHPALFMPKAKPAEPKVASNGAVEASEGSRPVVLAQATLPEIGMVDVGQGTPVSPIPDGPEALEEASASGFTSDDHTQAAAIPAAGSVAGNDQATGALPTPAPAELAPSVTPNELRKSVELPSAAPPDVGVDTVPPVVPASSAPPSSTEPAKPTPTLEPSKPVAPRPRLSDQPAKRGGQVAVFVSRKEKKIFVRQGFIPVLEMPIAIDIPDQPLGTHVFTAVSFTDEGAGMRWNVMTVPNELQRAGEPRDSRKRLKEPPRPVETKPASTAAEALDRIHMPQEAVERISELLIPGSSLVVSDEGLGRETGRMTEFIVLTR